MYRTAPPTKKKRASIVRDRSTDTIIEIENGTISRMAFPCFYVYRDDGLPLPADRSMALWRDHIGWPSAGSPDKSYQVMGVTFEPIHLEDEGYDDIDFVIQNMPTGLSISHEFDDNIIRITITSECEDAIEEDIEVKFSLYISGKHKIDFAEYQAKDLVTKGIIRILSTYN